MSNKVRIDDVITSEYSDFLSYCSSASKVFISELSNIDFVAFRTSFGKTREYVNKIRKVLDNASQVSDRQEDSSQVCEDIKTTLDELPIIQAHTSSEVSMNDSQIERSELLEDYPLYPNFINDDKCNNENSTNEALISSAELIESSSTESSEADTAYSLADIYGVDASSFAGRKIDDLNLTARSYNCLCRLKLDTIDKLLSKTVEELQSMRYLGTKSINDILQKASKYVSAYKTVPGLRHSKDTEKEVKLLDSNFKSAIESLLSGDEYHLDGLSETQQEYFSKFKNAVEIIGADICLEAYNSPQYSAVICNLLCSFADTYDIYLNVMKEASRLITCLPESIQQLRAAPFIQAYTVNNNKVLLKLLPECDDDTKIIHIPKLLENIWSKEDLNALPEETLKFLKWLDFDISNIASTIFEQIRSVISRKNSKALEVFMLRFRGETLEALGNKYGVTRERIRQIENKICKLFWKIYEQQEYDIISLIYALRNGDNVLYFDEIKDTVNEEFALVLKACLKHSYDHSFYQYLKNFDAVIIKTAGAEIVDEHSLISKLNSILNSLPDVMNVCDKKQALENLAISNAVPLEILTDIFDKQYHQANAFLYRGYLSIAYMCEYVLKNRFQSGYKIADDFESERFKQYLLDLFGDKADSITKRAIDAKVGEIGVLCDRGKYIHPDYLQVDDILVTEINEYIEQSSRSLLTYGEIFEALKTRLEGSQITNRYILQGTLKKYGCKFDTGRDFVRKVQYVTFVDELESFVEERGIVHKSEILAEFTSLGESGLGQVAARSANVFNIDNGYYIHASQFDIQPEDYEPIRNYLMQACKDIPVNIRVIYDEIAEKFPAFMYRNDFDERNKLYAALNYMFREDFNFSRPFIAKLGAEGVTNRSVILQHIIDYDTIEIDELIDICEENGINYVGVSHLCQSLAPDFVRISQTSMMRKELTGITDGVVNKVVEIINELLQCNDYIVGSKITDFLWFPQIDVEWNEFLLESIIIQSKKVSIIYMLGDPLKHPNAIYVSKTFQSETFDSFLIKILQDEVHKGSFTSKVEMRDWLREAGLIEGKLPNFLESAKYFYVNGTGVHCVENE